MGLWLGLYAIMGLVTLGAYGLDKIRARRGGRRIRESTLHLLALAGGVVGALAGQWLFRHKSRKRMFLAVTWLIAALHVAGWAWWLVAR